MPEGPQYYPEDMITDVQERFIVAEIVREKALKNLRDEVPHGIAVDVIQMKQNEKGTYHIEVDLICEKDSHKGIIIGKNGASLKKIGETSCLVSGLCRKPGGLHSSLEPAFTYQFLEQDVLFLIWG